jgi:hypothetical protein
MPFQAQPEPVQPGQGLLFEPPGGVDAAHRRLIAHHDLQFDFTPYIAPAQRPPPHWFETLGRLIKALAPVLEVIFWAGVAAAVLLILYLVARELGFIRWRPQRKKGIAAFSYQPDAATARGLLADADTLAAEGRFAEAVHVLLQRSIDDMRTRRPRAIAASLTSRDIESLPALPEAVRPAFGAMARLVEHSLFAGRPVGQPDFARARSAYEDFAFPGAW